MALQYVGGNTGTWAGANTGNNTISLTSLTGGIATSAAAGDLVIAVYAVGSSADRALSITDGTGPYTLIGAELYANGTTYDTNLAVEYKLLTAADTSVTFGPTGANTDAGAAAVHVWRGVDPSIFDGTPATATGTGSGRPNGAAVTPTQPGSVVIVAGGAAAATGAVFVAAGLSNFSTATSADNNDAMVGVGSFAWTSGTYDPAVWTGGTTNAADSWAAVTFTLLADPKTMLATPGGYAATGASAVLLQDQLLATSAGSYSVAGSSAITTPSYAVVANPGSLSLTGLESELTLYPGNSYNYIRWDTAGVDWDDFFWDETRTAVVPGAYSITGVDPTLTLASPVSVELLTNPGVYSVDGSGATVLLSVGILTSPGAYSLAGSAATVTRKALSLTTPGSYSLTGAGNSLELGTVAITTPGAYNATGADAITIKTSRADAIAGAYSLTGSSARTMTTVLGTTSPGAYSLSGQPATQLGKFLSATQPGSILITGAAAETSRGQTITTTSGGYSLTGLDADMQVGEANLIETLPGGYVIGGASVGLLYSGADDGTAYRGFIVNMGRMMSTASGERAPMPPVDLPNLLLEDGGNLLLEDGGLILLE